MMSSKGIPYWTNIWDQAKKKLESTTHDIYSSEQTQENYNNLFFIDEMLKNYSELYFTTYGTYIHEMYFNSKSSATLARSFMHSNFRINKESLLVGAAQDILIIRHSLEPDKEETHLFYLYKDEEEQCNLERVIKERMPHFRRPNQNCQTPVLIHAHQSKNPRVEFFNLIKIFPQLQILKNQDYYPVAKAMQLLAEKFADKPIAQDGDLHQILQVISNKTNVSIEEMGFTIQVKTSFSFSSMFFPAQNENEKGDRKSLSPVNQ